MMNLSDYMALDVDLTNMQLYTNQYYLPSYHQQQQQQQFYGEKIQCHISLGPIDTVGDLWCASKLKWIYTHDNYYLRICRISMSRIFQPLFCCSVNSPPRQFARTLFTPAFRKMIHIHPVWVYLVDEYNCVSISVLFVVILYKFVMIVYACESCIFLLKCDL